MDKVKENISIAEFYQSNQNRYLGGQINETLNNLINDFRLQHPKMFEPVNNTLVAVKSIQEALSNLDFNWESKYKNHSFLSFYKQNEPINNLLDFYQANKGYYDGLELKYSEIIGNLLNAWQEFSGDTVQNTGSFYNQALNLERRIIFIKNNDLKDYLANKENFDHKIFGDKTSNVSLIFIYKVNDQEFSTDNLQKIILSHKIEKYGKE